MKGFVGSKPPSSVMLQKFPCVSTEEHTCGSYKRSPSVGEFAEEHEFLPMRNSLHTVK
jgi:hypothetical protein